MGFIKNLFKNDTTVIGLRDLERKNSVNIVYETKSFVINKLFMESPDDNFLLKACL